MRVFWRRVGVWLLFIMVLVACGGSGVESAAQGEAEPAGVKAVEPAGDTAAAEEVAAPAGAKLQFIEFYADW